MNYTPDEVTLINYVYGELSGEDKAKIEAYLNENPDLAEEIQGVNDTRKIMAAYENKEVIPPADLFKSDLNISNSQNSSAWKMIMAVAASVSLILLVGFLTGFNTSYTDKGFQVGFDKSQSKSEEPIKLDQIEKLVRETLAQNREQQQRVFTSYLQILDSSNAAMLTKQKSELTTAINEQFKFDREQLDVYTQNLERKNAALVNQYFESSGLEQQVYVKNLLVDFTAYLEEQRIQDRDFYLNRLIDLKVASDLKQEETEQMLASIIKSVNNIPNEETTQNF
ncbi:MAG: hypothetical protein AAF843_15770 [Bacteroidota bacterium]